MHASDNLVRYFGELEAGRDYALYQSLLRSGLAITTAAIPVLLLRWQETKSLRLLATASISFVVMAITFRRGSLAFARLAFVITSFILGRNRRGMLAGILALVVGFLRGSGRQDCFSGQQYHV